MGASVARVMVDPGCGRGRGPGVTAELVAVARAGAASGSASRRPWTASRTTSASAAAASARTSSSSSTGPRRRAATYGLLAGWIKTGEAVDGYSLMTYDSRCPDDLAAAFTGGARHVMNDAPRYQGEPEARYTVDQLRSAEVTNVVARHDWWRWGLRHDDSGEIVGISDLFLPQAGRDRLPGRHRRHGRGAPRAPSRRLDEGHQPPAAATRTARGRGRLRPGTPPQRPDAADQPGPRASPPPSASGCGPAPGLISYETGSSDSLL